MLRKIITILFGVYSTFSFSQSDFMPARPSQSMGASVVGNNNLLLESGFRINDGNFNNTSMLRYGILENIELNMVVSNSYNKDVSQLTERTIQMALRLALLKGDKSSVGYEFRIKQNDDLNQTDNPFYSLEAMSAHDFSLTNRINLTVNYGVSKTLVKDGTTAVNYTIKPVYNLGSNSLFFESFGNIVTNTTGLDMGYSRIIKEKIQVDIGLGISDISSQNTLFGVLGASWKINKN